MLKWPSVKTMLKRSLAGNADGIGCACYIPVGTTRWLLIGLPAGAWQAALATGCSLPTLARLI